MKIKLFPRGGKFEKVREEKPDNFPVCFVFVHVLFNNRSLPSIDT